MGRLDCLPHELLLLITEYCSFEDCKALRETSKYLGSAANKTVFRTYYIAFFQSHLERFISISKDPDIAKCIKHFVFVGDVLPQIDSIDTFERLIDMREPWSAYYRKYIEERIEKDPVQLLIDDYDHQMRIVSEMEDLRPVAGREYDRTPKHNLTTEQLQHHYAQYKAHRQEQLDWDVADQFQGAFSRLPNLVSVENAKHGFADNHLCFPWNRIQKHIIINPNHWMQLYAIEVDDEDVEIIDLLKFPIHGKHTNSLLTAITHRACSTDGKPLTSMKLVNVGGQPLLDIGQPNDEDWNFGTMSSKIQGLSHLTSLDLDLGYTIPPLAPTTATQSWQTMQLFQEVHAILSAAPNLQILKLKCDDDESDWALEERPMDAEDDTVRLLDIPTLSKLHTLRLSCTATEDSMIDLLHAQAGTLQCLEIVDCTLNKGTWSSMLRRGLSGLGHLKRVYLEGLHDADYPPESGEEALYEDGFLFVPTTETSFEGYYDINVYLEQNDTETH